MNDTPAFVTLAEFARLHGVSKPCVTGWRKKGYVVIVDGKVDVVASNRRLADRPDVYKGGATRVRPGKAAVTHDADLPNGDAPADGWSMHEARRREMVAAAKMRELALAREAGSVVPKAEVLGAVRAEYTIVRTAMLGLASKLAHRLAVCSSPEGCLALVDSEVRALLSALTIDGAQ
jgi:hypothetical protein